MSRVIGSQSNVSGLSFLAYPNRHWLNPMASGTPQNLTGEFSDNQWTRRDGGYIDLNARIWFFTDYYSLSPGMISQTPGKGAKYDIGFVASDNNTLTRDSN